MEGSVSHKGKIISVDGSAAKVEIISQSACASCHAAGFCSATDQKRKLVDVHVSGGYSVGEEVLVVLQRSMGMRAVLLAYALPLLVVLAVTVLLSYAGVAELVSGLAGIGALALWYLGVYLFRSRIASGYAFTIKKITNNKL